MTKLVQVTGATEKVGSTFIQWILSGSAFENTIIRALYHNRVFT